MVKKKVKKRKGLFPNFGKKKFKGTLFMKIAGIKEKKKK